jgi:plastocyanin
MTMTPIPTLSRSTQSRRTRRFSVGLGVVLLFAMVTLPSLVADPVTPPREIVLVARNMAFYLDGNPTPNPTLRVKAGEQVTLVLRSEDVGITHDFAVKSWNVGTDLLSGKGAVSVSFRVPDRSDGPKEYTCSAHAVMMKGTIEIE